MSQPQGLKLKLKLPSSASADPSPTSDAATAGSGVKLKLNLGGAGIKASSGSGNGHAQDGRQETEQTDEVGDAVKEASVEAGHPTTKIKLNIGKLANHTPDTDSTYQTASTALEPIKHQNQASGDGSRNDTASEDTPAKRGRGAVAARGKRGVSGGTRGRGRGRPRGSGKGRGKAAVESEINAGDLAGALEMDGGPMDVDQAPVESAAEKPQVAPAAVMQPTVKQDCENAPSSTSVQADNDSVAPTTNVNAIESEPNTNRPATPAIVQPPPATAPTTSVTFAIPSPELSPAPSPPLNPTSQLPTPTIVPLTLPRRSVSVMSASGNPATEGSAPMTMTPDTGTPTGGIDEPTEAMLADAAATGRVLFMGKGRPYLRAKKPLKDVLRKVLADIKRKDSYGLFLEPVDQEEFPGYLDMIGGPDNAMDLATMNEKLEAGRYRTVDQFESDIEKMIRAAQIFNPDDSLVHREAEKIKTLAEKHIAKNRPLIRTPSPSPEPVGRRADVMSRMSTGLGGSTPFEGTPLSNGRSVSPGAEADGTSKRGAIIDDLPPHQLIPEQMLDYPPNTDIALTVGWYLTGGKRLRSRKEQRAKEKWDGQWREWYTTGDRNLREADDLFDLFERGFDVESRGEKLVVPRTIDWSDEAMRSHDIWQPQPTYTGFEHEERAPKIPMRPVDHWDFGRYQSLPEAYGWSATRPVGLDRGDFVNKVKLDLRPPEFGPQGAQYASWLRPEEDPLRYLKVVSTGEDVVGEAYLKSVDAFVRGAEENAKRNWNVMREEEESRKKVKVEENAQAEDQKDLGLGKSLGQYVATDWRGGMFSRKMQRTIDLATKAYKLLRTEARVPDSRKAKASPVPVKLEDMELVIMKALVQEISAKIPIRQEVLEWAARKDGLELAALLQQIQDFSATGPNGGPPSAPAERAKWFTDSLKFTGDQIVRESKRLVEKARERGGSGELDGEDLQRIREIRLNLLGLAKNVPVHELRPMSKDEAARLPPAVRNLIKILPDKPVK
ncbi:hypothetical protein NliqN6_6786 [Naganishia liquefaciens]|uniref:Bromo domain-containing protein n=1 Tax=Naganishia liquefaciens TaxID=104408 RepID=A0A8H3YHX8_9TREE|nr:hypothetical protein NliqN6_6786 [Naganishia liquefaciens]